jgi:alpha-pyrone synthase
MKTFINALGTANPAYSRSQEYATDFIAKMMKLSGTKKKHLESASLNSGIKNRFSVLEDYTKECGDFSFFPNTEDFLPFPTTADRMRIYEKEAIELACEAIKNCVAKLKNFSLSEVTHVITVSCTGMYTPGIDIELVQRLNLKSHTHRTAINFMGCYGAFNGLKMANAFCLADPDATVLLVCVELCSLHIQKNSALDNIFANLLFADGAAAVIVQAKHGDAQSLLMENFYCDLVPDTGEQMAWHVGNTGFEMALSAYVPRTIEKGIAAFSEKLLLKGGYKISDMDFFAIHPGGRKILEACETALGISHEDNRYSYAVLEQFGNMSSATVLFVLEAILRDVTVNDQDKKILGMGFGPGLTLESMLLKVC